jgi:hypothetical protein
MNMQTLSYHASMILVTCLLFRNTYFTTKLSSDTYEQLKDVIFKEMSLVVGFNISDYIPCLKQFDPWELQHHMNQVLLKVPNLQFIQDHWNEKRLDDSKESFFCLFVFLKNDNKLKVVFNVSYLIFYLW